MQAVEMLEFMEGTAIQRHKPLPPWWGSETQVASSSHPHTTQHRKRQALYSFWRSLRRSLRLTAWKPALMGCTLRLDPQALQFMNHNRLTSSLLRSVSSDLHMAHMTYSPGHRSK